jgi:hypothetical protein
VASGHLERERAQHTGSAVERSSRGGRETFGDLALHEHAPAPHERQAADRVEHERRRDVVRQVGDEGGRRRLEPVQGDAHGIAPVHRDVCPALERARQRRLQAAVDLDRVHVRTAAGQARSQSAHAGADLERNVLRLQPRQPLDHAEQVVVDEEMLSELLVRTQAELGQARERDLAGRAHGSAKTRAAFASTCAANSPAVTPRIAATARSVSST